MKITRCKVNHLTNPMGFQLNDVRFSWTVEEANGRTQASARIIVKLHHDQTVVADTGFAQLDSLCTSVPLALLPRTRYDWCVTVRSDCGEEAVSDMHYFETAKQDEPWAAQWITCESAVSPNYHAVAENAGFWHGTVQERMPVFSKQLPLRGEVVQGRLYICGLGLYEASLNGQKIGDDYMAPFCNNYNAWLQYQTYDITAQLNCGGALSVMLGDGWYRGRFGWEHEKPAGFYGKDHKLIAEVRVTYADGSTDVFGSDETWQVTRSAITFSNIYDGEHVDTTLPAVAAAAAQRCPAPEAKLTARYSLPVTVYEQRKPELIITPKQETVLDLGQNIVGSFELSVCEPRGTLIHLQFGEVLQDECFYRDNLRSAMAEYYFITDGMPQVIKPRFTFFGYRYVKLTGVTNFKPDDFTALVLTSQLEEIGSLTTGHRLVNQLISNTGWSRRDNFLDVPTDCPQRDERMGWTGDAQVFTPTACFLSDAYAFYRKFLYDMATEQAANGGMVPAVIPAFSVHNTSCVWGDATTIMPWRIYQFTGDSTILCEHYPSMKAWVDYLVQLDGDGCHWRDSFHYGDWLALDVAGADVGNCRGATDEGYLADVYYMYSAELVSQAAQLLGYADDAAHYDALSKRIRARILHDFYTPSGRCAIPTQTALLLTLRHGLSDIEQTKQALLRHFQSRHNKLQTGFVGAPILCKVLSDFGLDDLAVTLLLNEDYPGWLHEVKLGATTIWERWNSLDDEGRISSTGMNSLNHYAYGSIVEWIYERLAGLKASEPGFRKVALSPLPVKALGKLDCVYESAAGHWESHWAFADDAHLTISVTVPFGTTARLTLPMADASVFTDASNPMFRQVENGVCILPAGTYTVTYPI